MMIMPYEKLTASNGWSAKGSPGGTRHHNSRCKFKSTVAIVRTCRTLNNAIGDSREEDLQQSLGPLKVAFIFVASTLAAAFSYLHSGQGFWEETCCTTISSSQ